MKKIGIIIGTLTILIIIIGCIVITSYNRDSEKNMINLSAKINNYKETKNIVSFEIEYQNVGGSDAVLEFQNELELNHSLKSISSKPNWNVTIDIKRMDQIKKNKNNIIILKPGEKLEYHIEIKDISTLPRDQYEFRASLALENKIDTPLIKKVFTVN
jgi:hypothetical protein